MGLSVQVIEHQVNGKTLTGENDILNKRPD